MTNHDRNNQYLRTTDGDNRTAIHMRRVWEAVRALDGCTVQEIAIVQDMDIKDVQRAIWTLRAAVPPLLVAEKRGNILRNIRPADDAPETLPPVLFLSHKRSTHRDYIDDDGIGEILQFIERAPLFQVLKISIACKERRERDERL